MSAADAEIAVVDDATALARALADTILTCARAALDERGTFDIALSGGSTPKAAYRLLAAEPDALDWKRVRFFFGDERCVAPTSDESNYHTARTMLFDPLGIALDRVFRMRGEIDPNEAARDYATILSREVGASPAFDLVVLGLGPDAHTASLFPGTDPETDAARLVRAPWVEKFSTHRLTITPTVINAARDVVFATAGEEKAEALYDVLEGDFDPTRFPAQIVRLESGRVRWLVDRAAAARIVR